MRPFSFNKNQVIASAVSVAVPALILFGVVYFFLIPVVKSNILLKRQIKDKKQELGVVQVPIKEYGSLKEDMNKKNAELSGVKNELFWEKDISKFLNELTRLASDLQIEFISLKPESLTRPQEDPEADKKDSQETKFLIIPISVAFKSSYMDTMVFLKRIEAGQRFIRIDSLNIESETGNILKHLTKMQLSIFIENDS
jgi:hypothetical protein